MPPRKAKRSRTVRQWERLEECDERATTKETRIGPGTPSTFTHQQDTDGKDGGILGDHGGAEAEDLPTTRRMRNTVQVQACSGSRTDP
jgi:hypothetical protein